MKQLIASLAMLLSLFAAAKTMPPRQPSGGLSDHLTTDTRATEIVGATDSTWLQGLAGDGIVDETAVINAAMASKSQAGGGVVRLAPFQQHLVDSGNLTVPRNVRLACEAPMLGERFPNESWLKMPCAVILNPAYTVQVGQQAQLDGIAIVRKGMMPPDSMRSAVNMIAAFAGTAITIAGIDARLSNVMIAGFNECVMDSGYERLIATDLDGDCTDGIVSDNSHDISTFTRLHFWDFTIGHPSGAWADHGTYAITGFADNGAGNLRLTFVPGAEPPVTGDLIAFSNMRGLPFSARQRLRVTVFDPTHMDLPTPYPAPFTISGTTVAGSNVISGVTGAAGLGVGMSLTHGGIFPAGSRIVSVSQNAGRQGDVSIVMSAIATHTVTSNGIFTFSPLSQPGGIGYIDLAYRAGKGFTWTNGERNSCDHCFEFGHRVGFYLGTGALWTDLASPASDMLEHEDSNAFGLVFDKGSANSMVSNPWISGHGHALYVASSGGPAHTITGGSFNQAAVAILTPTLQFVSGKVALTGSSVGILLHDLGQPSIVIGGETSDKVILVGNDFGEAPIVATDAQAAARLVAVGNVSGSAP